MGGGGGMAVAEAEAELVEAEMAVEKVRGEARVASEARANALAEMAVEGEEFEARANALAEMAVEEDARLSLVAAQVEEDARLPLVAEMVVNDAVMGIAVMVGLPVEEDAQALAVAGDVVMGMAGMEEMDHGDTDSDTPFKAAQRRS